MTDVETDAQERHLSFDNEASSPLDGDDGARGEAAAVAEPDENDTWVDPRTVGVGWARSAKSGNIARRVWVGAIGAGQ